MKKQAGRLTRRRDFLAVQSRGVRAFTGPVLVLALEGEAAGPRLGVTVSSKVAGAVVRNRIKRRVRAAFRGVVGELPSLDIVVIARRGADALSMDGIREALLSVRRLRRGGMGG